MRKGLLATAARAGVLWVGICFKCTEHMPDTQALPVPAANDGISMRRNALRRADTHRRLAVAAGVSELAWNPMAGVTQPSTCSWPVCAGFVLDFGPMFLFRVAAAFLATALFSSADFDAAQNCCAVN